MALVVAAVALFAVVSSGGQTGSSSAKDASDRPAATATPAKTQTPKREERSSARTYTVKPGDTPSGIAAAEDVDVDELLEANPDVDADSLTVGQELKLP